MRLSKGQEDAKVGSLARGLVNVAKTATTATVKVSGFVAGRVGKLTKSLDLEDTSRNSRQH